MKDAPDYGQAVKAVFAHHTDTGNAYTCGQSPQVIRLTFTYHVTGLGCNFLIDKCGTLFEGRASGVERSVHGAHTYGFITDTTGVAVLGTHISTASAQGVLDTVAKVSVWKLIMVGQDPAGKVNLASPAPGGTGKYPYGTPVTFNAISGHRDGYATEYPGEALYAELCAIHTAAVGLHRRWPCRSRRTSRLPERRSPRSRRRAWTRRPAIPVPATCRVGCFVRAALDRRGRCLGAGRAGSNAKEIRVPQRNGSLRWSIGGRCSRVVHPLKAASGPEMRATLTLFLPVRGLEVGRGGVEPPTFRFSGGRSYRLSYLPRTCIRTSGGPDGI